MRSHDAAFALTMSLIVLGTTVVIILFPIRDAKPPPPAPCVAYLDAVQAAAADGISPAEDEVLADVAGRLDCTAIH